MPLSKASSAFSSRLPDNDPSQQSMDLFIALTVLEKLEASYSKSLLSLDEYESELAACVKQCRKAHRLVAHAFPTLTEFAQEFSSLEHGGTVTGTVTGPSTEFQRALVQLDGGADLIGGASVQDPARDDTSRMATNAAATTTARDFLKISDCIADIKEVIEAYETDSYHLAVGRVRDLVNTLMGYLERLDQRAMAIASMQDRVEKMQGWQAKLDGMESRALVDSQALMTDLKSLKRGLLDVGEAYNV
jgi:hypothetical protein